jgi:hypothetical protein
MKLKQDSERDALTALSPAESQILEKALSKNPLARLEPQEKELLWRARLMVVDNPKALPPFLRSVAWANRKGE